MRLISKIKNNYKHGFYENENKKYKRINRNIG